MQQPNACATNTCRGTNLACLLQTLTATYLLPNTFVVCVCVCVCVCAHTHMPPLPTHMITAHTTHPSTLPSAVQAENTMEAKGAHATSHTTLLRSKVNMGFLEQETQTWSKRHRHAHTQTEVQSKEGGTQCLSGAII